MDAHQVLEITATLEEVAFAMTAMVMIAAGWKKE